MPVRSLQSYHLGNWSRTALDALVRQPSVSPEQARKKMVTVKHLIGPQTFENRITDYWEEEPEGVPYLICQLGQRESAQFTAFFVAHIDTVKASPDWVDAHTLVADSREPDKLRGLGVYDMQSSVVNGIRLLRELQVPEGLCLYVAFTGDEEYRSHAAKHIINEWPHFPSIDLVLSSEIGPLHITDPNDVTMRIIQGRRGILKTSLHVKLVKGAGHGARPAMPSAYHELAQVYRIWSPDALDPLPEALRDSAPVLKGHPILGLSTFGQDQPVSPALGYEEIFCADLDVRSEALVRPQTARMNLKTLLIPPSTIESALQAQIESLKRIGVLRDWAGRGVSASLTRLTNSTSYPPFWIPSDHPYIEAVNQAVMRVSGEPAILEAGTSNADENKYVIEGEKPGLSVPMKGGGPHSPLEWLSASDMARNYLMFRELFSRCLPDLVAAKHKL